jgi:hypothetical protein
MSENSDAKTWLEAAQQVLGVSFGQLIGLLLPAGLGCWYWSMSTTPERELWPALTPFEWIAEASENVGVSGSWALDISAWIGERPDWFWPFLLTAAVLTAMSNLARHPTAVVGLTCVPYAAALEVHNSVLTLLAYRLTSGAFCAAAVIVDLGADDRRDGYISYPGMSFIKWAASGQSWPSAG